MESKNYFKGKSTEEHLSNINSLKNGILESHSFPKNNLIIFFTAFKNLLFYLLAITIFSSIALPHIILSCSLLFSLGLAYSLWISMQKIWQEWSYLELCHRWIKEERKEIDSNLDQEIQELRYIYKYKGFQNKLLDQIVDYLGSDSNLLLQAMIEDEFGINLKSFPHPLQQGLTLFLGGLTSILIFLCIYSFTSTACATIIIGLFLTFLNTLSSYLIKNQKIKSAVWSLAIFVFSIMFSLFTYKILTF